MKIALPTPEAVASPMLKGIVSLVLGLGFLTGCTSGSQYQGSNTYVPPQEIYLPNEASQSFPTQHEWYRTNEPDLYFPSEWDWQHDAVGFGTAAAVPVPSAINNTP